MATKFPCNFRSLCPDPDNPFENLSSESDDGPTFLGTDYGFGRPNPKLGSSWRAPTGTGFCESQVSAEAAFLCAARNQFEAASDSQGTPPEFPLPDPEGNPATNPVTPPSNPPTTPQPVFYNAQTFVTVYCPDGLPFITVVQSGQFSSYSQALANQMAQTAALDDALLYRFCLGNISPVACDGVPYSSAIVASGGTAGGQEPFTFFIVDGELPLGLTLTQISPRSAVISGTPYGFGGYGFMVRAVDSLGNYMDKYYVLTVVGIIDTAIPDFASGTPYSHQFAAVLNAAPGTWALTAGTLPDGLSIDSAGLLSGTPTSSEATSFTLTVTDADGFACSADFTINTAVCVDWSTLVWDFFHLSSTTAPAVNTGSVAGDTFEFDMLGRAVNAQVVGGAHGSLTYTGEGCNCLLTINITSMETALNSTLVFEVVINQDSVEVLHVILQHAPFIDTNGLVVGVNVIPFTIAAGVNSVIEVDGKPFTANHEIIRCGGAIGGLINGQMTFTATLSNA